MKLRVASFLSLLVFLSAFPFQAQAARFSGKYLMSVCASDEDGNELVEGGHIACQAYISGVIDYHNLVRSLGASTSVEFCVPENVPEHILQKQVRSYLFKHRKDHSNFSAAPGVALGLYAAWPCKK